MTHTPDTLAADRLAYARRVATDPGFAPFPEERAAAWAMLKQARGKTHCLWRLGFGAAPGSLADTIETISRRGLARRIRARAAQIDPDDTPTPPSAA